MKKLIGIVAFSLCLSSPGRSLVHCYLNQLKRTSKALVNAPIPGTEILFDRRNYMQRRLTVHEGYVFRLIARSEPWSGDDHGYLHIHYMRGAAKDFDFTQSQRLGKLPIDNLSGWGSSNKIESSEVTLLLPGKGQSTKFNVKAVCQNLDENDALIRVFNQLHRQDAEY